MARLLRRPRASLESGEEVLQPRSSFDMSGESGPASPFGTNPDRTLARTILCLLILIVLTSGIVGFLTLTRGHDWGDDFAAYIMQAQSIADGKMQQLVQRSTFAVEASSGRFGPVTLPWGFPLLLAPVYALFGMKISGVQACSDSVLHGIPRRVLLVGTHQAQRSRIPAVDSRDGPQPEHAASTEFDSFRSALPCPVHSGPILD